MDRARPRLRRPELLFAQLLGGLILRSSPKKSSPNFGFTEFTEVRMQERAHNAPEWRYMAVCGDGTARPGVEETTRGSFFEALRTENAALRLDRHGTVRPQGSDRPGSPRPHPARLRPGADQGRRDQLAQGCRVRHAAVEAALIEARRRVGMNEGRG